MGELLHSLGFNPIKFFFTIFNFLLVFWLLKRYLFGGIFKTLEERKVKIKEGLEVAEKAKKELEQAQVEASKIIAQAKEEAEKIKKTAEEIQEQLITKAKSEAEKIIKEARVTLEQEKKEIRKEMYVQLIDLVSLATRRVLEGVVGEEEQRLLVEKAVSKIMEEASS